jgi:hypothetical protein
MSRDSTDAFLIPYEKRAGTRDPIISVKLFRRRSNTHIPRPAAEAGKLLALRLGCVLFAHGCKHAKLHDASEYMRSHVGTTGVIAEIFLKLFFMPVRSGEARLDGYPGHNQPRGEAYAMFSKNRCCVQVTCGQPGPLRARESLNK